MIHSTSISIVLAVTLGADLVGLKPIASSPVHVVLIGGFVSDPSPEQLEGMAGRGGNSGLFRLLGDLSQYDRVSAEYFNWNGTRAGKIKSAAPPMAAGIAKSVREHHAAHPDQRLIIVGNSWGGHAARETCELLAVMPVVPIEHVIFLDPSSLARVKHGQRTGELPANVKRATNYYTHHLLSWRRWDNEPRVTNIDLGDPKYGFQFEGGPPYDSTIDTRGHIYAEWDERIHYDIRRRIAHVRFAMNKVRSRD